MDLYLVTGISYLFTSICLKVNENHDVPGDLVIVDHFAHVEEYRQRLEQTGLFRRVDVVSKQEYLDWGQLSRRHRFRMLNLLASIKVDVLRKFPRFGQSRYRAHAFYNQRYDRIYTSGTMNAFLWFLLNLIKRYHSVVYLYDSGIITRNARKELPQNARDRKAREYGCLFVEDHIAGRYYFETTGANPIYGKPMQQILPTPENETLRKIILQVFDYRPEDDQLFRHRALFMHQCFDAHAQYVGLPERQRALWEAVLQEMPDAMICLHPRTGEQYEPAHVISGAGSLASYDVRCMFAKDLEQKVLLTCFSNALLTPKHTFGKEPYLVFLYKLLGMEEVAHMTVAQWDDLIERSIIACYKDPTKVYIPASMDELHACLAEISKKLQGS